MWTGPKPLAVVAALLICADAAAHRTVAYGIHRIDRPAPALVSGSRWSSDACSSYSSLVLFSRAKPIRRRQVRPSINCALRRRQ